MSGRNEIDSWTGRTNGGYAAPCSFMPAHADWLASLRAAGRSPITVESYSRDLEQIARAIGSDCTSHRKVAEFGQSTIDTLSDHWHSVGASRSTVLRRWAALRGFSSFLCVQGIDCGPVLSSRLPPPARAGRVTLDETELDALTGRQQPARSNTAARDRAIVVLKAGTGVTTGELAALDVADIDVAHGTVNVVRTHLKPRVLRMASETSEPIAAYVDGVRGSAPGPLFLSLRGTRLCPRSIQLMFRRLRRHHGVREDATLSSLRHTLGAGFAKNGVSLENLATVMGLTAASASRYFRQEGDHHA